MTGLTVPEQWTHHEIDARFNYDALPGAQDGTLTDQQEHSLRAGYEKLNEVAHDELASRGENDTDAQRAVGSLYEALFHFTAYVAPENGAS
jgi:hypothetical protein